MLPVFTIAFVELNITQKSTSVPQETTFIRSLSVDHSKKFYLSAKTCFDHLSFVYEIDS